MNPLTLMTLNTNLAKLMNRPKLFIRFRLLGMAGAPTACPAEKTPPWSIKGPCQWQQAL